MGQTMVEKIVSRQVGRTVYVGEKIERLPITKLFFNDVITSYTDEALEWLKKDESRIVLTALKEELEQHDRVDLDGFKSMMKVVQEKTTVKGKELWMPVRCAITGMTAGPELPQVIEILGRDKMIRFLEQVLS